jgi:hypothetical protein
MTEVKTIEVSVAGPEKADDAVGSERTDTPTRDNRARLRSEALALDPYSPMEPAPHASGLPPL